MKVLDGKCYNAQKISFFVAVHICGHHATNWIVGRPRMWTVCN